MKSINLPGEDRCVDVFMRPDGTFGFGEFRRDVEDNRGWFPIGMFGDLVFANEHDTLREARSKISWLNDAVKDSYSG